MDDERGKHGDLLDGTASGSNVNSEIDPSARQKRLGDRVRPVTHETTGESAIVRDGLGGVGHGEAAFLKAEGGGAIVAFGEWIVKTMVLVLSSRPTAMPSNEWSSVFDRDAGSSFSLLNYPAEKTSNQVLESSI